MSDLIQSLSRQLFTEDVAAVFAVLDGAAVPDLLDHLYGERPEFECLYRGELEPDMAAVAPYLVRLEQGTSFTDWVLTKGWGQHWGIFALTDAELPVLRRHFRKFLMVHDEQGAPLYFRYYDPRVLRQFLPTCNADEIVKVFGPIVRYVVEGEEAELVLRFRHTGGSLKQERASLA
jgi:Domain of unknown function (DUF4123)